MLTLSLDRWRWIGNLPTDYLKTTDLSIEAVTKYLNVNVKNFPTGFNVNNWPLDYPDAIAEAALLSILAQLDSKTSTLATQTTLASILAQLDNKTSTLATQTTLAAILAQFDNKTSTLATEATLGTVHGHVDSIDGKITACNTGAIAGSLTQSTKHDAKTYLYAFGDLAATGLLGCTTAASKVLKVHYYSLQSTVDGVTVYFYKNTGSTQISKKWILNAREAQESPFASAPAKIFMNTTTNDDIGINISGGATPHIYWEIIYSIDDAS